MQHTARFLCLSLLLVVTSLFAPYIYAQDAVSPFAAFANVDSTHYPTVQVAIYGDPGSGGIGELPLQVRENDQVQTVLTDTTATIGVQMAVVLDAHDLAAVGSSGQTRQAEVAGILLDLIEKDVVTRNQDWLAAFTVGADGAVSTIQDWTGEPNLIFNGTVQATVDPAVDDNQLTALALGVLDTFQTPAPANLARAMLLFTAGSSQLDVESAVARANSQNVHIHVVALADPSTPLAGEAALRDLATRTNGAFVRLQRAEDLPPLWRRLSALRDQRMLTYESTATAPVSLTVELAAGANETGAAPLVATADLVVPNTAVAAPQAAPVTAQVAPTPEAAAPDEAAAAVPGGEPTPEPLSEPTSAATPALASTAGDTAGETGAVSVSLPVATANQDEQPDAGEEPAALAADPTAAPVNDTIFVPGTAVALPRALLEMALPILLVLLVYFAFREVRERRKSRRQPRDATVSKAPPVTSQAADQDGLDDLQPLQPRRPSLGSPSSVQGDEAALPEPSVARTTAGVSVEEDDYDEATVVPLHFSDDEATYRLRESIDLPLLGVLVRVTNDPNLPQQLPVYGLTPAPGEVRQIHIGRHSKNNTVVINDKSISREHAVIIQKDRRLYLRDNASTAGTYLNWRQLKPGEELLLRHNDLISFGEIVYEFHAKGEDEATVVSG